MTELLFINQSLDIGGAEIFHRDLLQELQKQGCHLEAFVTKPNYVALLQKAAIPVQEIPVILDLIGDWKGLVKALYLWPLAIGYYGWLVFTHRRVNTILLSSFTEKIFVTPIAKIFGIKIVWIEFGPIHPLLKKFGGFPGYLYSLVKNLPTQIIVPSQHTKHHLVTHSGVDASLIKIIPCGRAISLSDRKMYQQVSVKKMVAVCVSRLEPGKGQDILIRAFPEVLKKFPQAKLQITGMSSWLTDLKKEVNDLDLSEAVEFIGRVPDALHVMAAAQVVVFPSVWELEGFGLVMIEAMALGKPIVAFAVGPAPEIIHHQRNGLLAKKSDVQDLAQQIISALGSSYSIQKMAATAAADFQDNYQMVQIANRYYQLLCNN